MKATDTEKINHEIDKVKTSVTYSWEIEGKNILNAENKTFLTGEEYNIIFLLYIKEEIPFNLRKNLWLISSGARDLLQKNVNYYSKLKNFYDILLSKKHPFYIYIANKISRDLYRSFSEEDNPDESKITKLKNILYAFTIRNLSLNYCQGLNLIVSNLLITTDYNEEESFYLLLKIMEDILPFDYYYYGVGIEAEMNMMHILLEKYDKELSKHLNKLNSYFLIISRLTMFITSLMLFKTDKKISNLFFDLLFLIKTNNHILIFYAIILSIFKILRNDLMECQESTSVNYIIEKFCVGPINEENYNHLIYYTLIDHERLRLNDITLINLRKKEITQILPSKKLNFEMNDKDNTIFCDVNYPLCIKENKIGFPIDNFTVYKPNKNLSTFVKDNFYYCKENEINLSEDNNEKKTENEYEKIKNLQEVKLEYNNFMEDVIIERRTHYCHK